MEANGIQRENIRMQGGLPISIRLHKNGAESGGCEFHWHEQRLVASEEQLVLRGLAGALI